MPILLLESKWKGQMLSSMGQREGPTPRESRQSLQCRYSAYTPGLRRSPQGMKNVSVSNSVFCSSILLAESGIQGWDLENNDNLYTHVHALTEVPESHFQCYTAAKPRVGWETWGWQWALSLAQDLQFPVRRVSSLSRLGGQGHLRSNRGCRRRA